MDTREAWSPEGFEEYRELYPSTPELSPAPDPEPTRRFTDLWNEGGSAIANSVRARANDTTLVFARGFLGSYMPGNLEAPCLASRRLGFDAFVASQRPGGSVAENVKSLARELETRDSRHRLVFCGHSRGGLECLTLLANRSDLSARCDGVVLSQTARGPSRVLESVLQGLHRQRLSRWRRGTEFAQRISLRILGADKGGQELTSSAWPDLVRRLDGIAWPFPVLQTASWSTRPTAWLDSFHERLGEIGPGRAHDGQFFLHDLIWPRFPHVLLPRLDHAQPAMGGLGFDHARYWLAVLRMVLP